MSKPEEDSRPKNWPEAFECSVYSLVVGGTISFIAYLIFLA